MELVDKPEFRVLHIGNERSWRGGENQIRLLVEGLKPKNVESHIAYPQGSRGVERFQKIVPTMRLNSTGPRDFLSIRKLVNYCEEHK